MSLSLSLNTVPSIFLSRARAHLMSSFEVPTYAGVIFFNPNIILRRECHCDPSSQEDRRRREGVR